jgi:hypothetical protein
LIEEEALLRHEAQWRRHLEQAQEQLNLIAGDKQRVAAILGANPELTEVARKMTESQDLARKARNEVVHGLRVVIQNPKNVSSLEKKRLLWQIAKDHKDENPHAEGVPFQTIKQVLEQRYGITTASAAMFFRNELKDWRTRGGNKNKELLLEKLEDHPSLRYLVETKGSDEEQSQ